MDQILFKKNTDFDTNKVFLEEFPMFKDCKRSIPPFILPNTINGACVIFRTDDNSQFIYKMVSHKVTLLGPSEELMKNFDYSWILNNVFKVSSTIIKSNNCINFTYEQKKYKMIIGDNDIILSLEV